MTSIREYLAQRIAYPPRATAFRMVEILYAAWEEMHRENAQLRKALNQHGHIAEFREDGFGLEHPLECREAGLLNCPMNDALKALPGPPLAPGRYVVSLADDGELLFGASV